MLLHEAIGVLFEPITDRLKAVEGRLSFIEGRINMLIRMERRDARRDRMANEAVTRFIERMTKEISENRDAVTSIEALVSNLAEQIRSVGPDEEALNKLADELDANTDRITKAVTDNTAFQPSAQ